MKRSFNFNSLDEAETCRKVSLVEQSPEPLGHRLVNVSSTFKVLRSDLMELADQVEKADSIALASSINKLELIAEQMKFLQNQARKVFVDYRQGLSLNHAACNFKRVPGQIYHLYQRKSGQKYFSMLSPEEWNSSIPHQFIGSFRFEHDMTWTPTERIDVKESNLKFLRKTLRPDSISPNEQCEQMVTDGQ